MTWAKQVAAAPWHIESMVASSDTDIRKTDLIQIPSARLNPIAYHSTAVTPQPETRVPDVAARTDSAGSAGG